MLQEYISVIGCVQGLLLSALLIGDKRMTTASRILGGVCFIIAVIFLTPFLFQKVDNSAIKAIFGIVFFLPVALGPLGYLYCRSVILGEGLTRKDLIHLLPPLGFYALTADVSLANPQAMIAWATGTPPPSVRFRIAEFVPVTIALAYTLCSIAMLLHYREKANDNLANFDPAIFRWLLGLQGFGLVVWTLKTTARSSGSPSLFNDIANLLLALLIYVIAIIQWRDPQFFAVPNLDRDRKNETDDHSQARARAPEGELDPATRAGLFDTVKARLEAERLYLDSELTLDRLAGLTGLSKHHLSEVLNRHAGKNFYDFINGYRVDFVRDRLAEGSNRSVLDIALEAGFSSKSAFNAIFKQRTGLTPTQYRASVTSQADRKTA